VRRTSGRGTRRRTGEQSFDGVYQVLAGRGLHRIVVERHVDDVEVRVDGGHHRDPCVQSALADLPQHVPTSEFGHPPIEEHHVDGRRQRVQGFVAAVGRCHLVPVGELRGVGVCHLPLVVHDEDPRAVRAVIGLPMRKSFKSIAGIGNM